jgi:hypothetical protein
MSGVLIIVKLVVTVIAGPSDPPPTTDTPATCEEGADADCDSDGEG